MIEMSELLSDFLQPSGEPLVMHGMHKSKKLIFLKTILPLSSSSLFLGTKPVSGPTFL
jgi:hypothetical protein